MSPFLRRGEILISLRDCQISGPDPYLEPINMVEIMSGIHMGYCYTEIQIPWPP